jgi:PAS domain S-box-containing protein
MKEESGDHQPARQDTAEDKRQDWPHPADDLQSVYGVFDHAPFALAALKGEDLVIEYINEYNLEIWQKTRQQVLGRPLFEVRPDIRPSVEAIHRQVYRTGQRFKANEIPVSIQGKGDLEPYVRYFDLTIDPMRDQAGQVTGQLAVSIEVTGQVLARRRAQESEAQLQRLIRQAPVGMCLFRGKKFVIELANERQLEIWGKTAEQVLGRPAFEALAEAVGQGFEELFQSVYQTGQAVVANGVPAELVRHGKRQLGYYNFTLEALREEDGRISGIVSVSSEVTELMVYQQRLEQSQAELGRLKDQLELTISAGRIGSWHWDVGADTLTWSKEQHELYGLQPGAFAGRLQDFLEMMHPQDLALVGQKRQVRAQSPDSDYTDEFRIIRKDGAVRWIQSRERKITDDSGRTVFVMGVNIDITEQKQTEELLREQQRFTESILEAAPSLIYIFDLATRGNVFVSPQIRDILGYSPQQVQAMGDGLLPLLLHQADATVTSARFEKMMAEPADGIFEAEYRMRHKDGSYVWLSDRARVFARDANGRPLQILGVTADITRRKELEQRMQAQFEELETIYQTAPIGLAMIDRQFRYVRVNRWLAQINGIPVEAHIGRTFRQIIPGIADQAEAVARQVFETGQPLLDVEIAGEIPALPGVTRIWRESWHPIKDARGEIFAISVTAEEVTEHKQAEAALRASENRFRIIADVTPNMVWIINADGTTRYVNRYTLEYFGLGEQDFPREWSDLVHPQDLERVGTLVRTALARSESYRTELRLRRHDGVYRHFVTSGVPALQPEALQPEALQPEALQPEALQPEALQPEGRIYGYIGTTVDITDIRQAQQRLAESEALFRSLAETLPQLVWVSDAQGEIQYYSARWVGYSGIEQVRQAWDYMVHPQDRRASKLVYRQAMAAGNSFRYELRLQNAAGEYRWHLSVAEPVTDASGRIVRWVGALSDIHEQKALHQQLEGIIAQRTKQLSRSNDELALANQQLQASNRELERFAYVASHDLQEPLRKIITFTRLLGGNYQDVIGDPGRDFLERVESAAGRMRNLIRSLLEYSRIGPDAKQFRPTDLNQTLRLVLTDLEVTIAEREAVMQAGPLPVVWANPDQMGQLLANLVSNALKFVPAGRTPRIRLRARAARAREKSELGLSAERPYVRVTISDNGIGFDPAFAESIFEPFRRLHGQSDYSGSGIGLSICRRIVQNHSGVIRARNQPNRGAAFVVLLPVEPLPL